jgi:hypothetical protein
MFSERDLVEAVERHLQQWAQSCRGVVIARAAAPRPPKRAGLRTRLEERAALGAARSKAIATGPIATGAGLEADAVAWRRAKAERLTLGAARGFSVPSNAPSPRASRTEAAAPKGGAKSAAPRAIRSDGAGVDAGAAAAADEGAPLALFLTPGRAVFLTIKRRRPAARPEEAVTLSSAERTQHRRLRDCGFAVHVIAAETPADARDQVSALLRRLGLPVNG